MRPLRRDRRSGASLGDLDFTAPDLIRPPLDTANQPATAAIMSMFRAKRLDLGGYVNIRNIRDHTKRKVFAANEPERYAFSGLDAAQFPRIVLQSHRRSKLTEFFC
jgi:hypothetical protein